MSDWGKIVFYYDYECADRYNGTKKVKGLVSKAYQYPGYYGMMLHAYNGVSYFLERCGKGVDFGMEDIAGREDISGWAALNTAFDVFFDFKNIVTGFDAVRYVIGQGDKHENEEGIDSLKKDLFNCEGTYGFLYSTYTGNLRDGYSLKYAYNHYVQGDDEDTGRLDDIRTVIGTHEKNMLENPEYADDKKYFEEISDFFDKNATLISSSEEFWGIERIAAEFIKESVSCQS